MEPHRKNMRGIRTDLSTLTRAFQPHKFPGNSKIFLETTVKLLVLKPNEGTSLVVQWQDSMLPVLEAWVQSLVRELDLTCHD